MKRYVISTFFILFALCLFGQDEYLNNKIENTNLKQIKNETLIDYNLLEQTKGKVTIIEFWETWCAPCIQAMHHLKKLKDKFPNELEIVCVSCDDLKKTISFVEKNKFPFTFIYDKEKYLKEQVFPHSGIPHSILVDKTGKIQAGTMPGFMTEEVINNLVNDRQIDIPQKTLFNPKSLSDEKSENTLINFELKSYQLGDRGYLQTENKSRPTRILTDYEGGYKDTIENITKYTAASKNILELYQIAYEDIPLTRFIYKEDLGYINSHLPNKRYTMIFSSSDLLGNHNSILINQLNSTFELKTSMQEQEVEVLIIDSIDTNTGHCKRSYDRSKSGMSSNFNILLFKLDASYINSMVIAKTLEDFFRTLNETREDFPKIPIETKIPAANFYDIKISIENDKEESFDTWLELFKEHGFILRKEKKILKFIEINSR